MIVADWVWYQNFYLDVGFILICLKAIKNIYNVFKVASKYFWKVLQVQSRDVLSQNITIILYYIMYILFQSDYEYRYMIYIYIYIIVYTI